MREPCASSAMQGNIRLEFALAQCIESCPGSPERRMHSPLTVIRSPRKAIVE